MNLERRDALWQEMMVLTAPVSEISPFQTKPLATPSSTTSAKRTAIGTPTLSPSALHGTSTSKSLPPATLDLFAQLEAAGTISTRGLKLDATHYCELVFDVNSAYFDNHGGYEFAKQFYEDAYKAAVQIVGGEQYILSAVMHADEINRAMTEALGREVYHYHLHVVYVPVVEKQILWSKRCKDKTLSPMQHHGIAHINADMGNAGGVVGADKKYKVAGLGLLRGNRGTDIAKALCAQPSHVPSAVIDYPAHKAAAIKAGAGRAAAPHIWITHILFRLGHHCGKGGVLQSLRGYLVVGRLLDGGSVGIGACGKHIIMGDDHHGAALVLESVQNRHNLFGGFGVQVAGG